MNITYKGKTYDIDFWGNAHDEDGGEVTDASLIFELLAIRDRQIDEEATA